MKTIKGCYRVQYCVLQVLEYYHHCISDALNERLPNTILATVLLELTLLC